MPVHFDMLCSIMFELLHTFGLHGLSPPALHAHVGWIAAKLLTQKLSLHPIPNTCFEMALPTPANCNSDSQKANVIL